MQYLDGVLFICIKDVEVIFYKKTFFPAIFNFSAQKGKMRKQFDYLFESIVQFGRIILTPKMLIPINQEFEFDRQQLLLPKLFV